VEDAGTDDGSPQAKEGADDGGDGKKPWKMPKMPWKMPKAAGKMPPKKPWKFGLAGGDDKPKKKLKANGDNFKFGWNKKPFKMDLNKKNGIKQAKGDGDGAAVAEGEGEGAAEKKGSCRSIGNIEKCKDASKCQWQKAKGGKQAGTCVDSAGEPNGEVKDGAEVKDGGEVKGDGGDGDAEKTCARNKDDQKCVGDKLGCEWDGGSCIEKVEAGSPADNGSDSGSGSPADNDDDQVEAGTS
jgi:hypothetical protein